MSLRAAAAEVGAWTVGTLCFAAAIAMWLADPPRVLFISAWTPHMGLPALRNAVGSVHHWHPEAKLQLFVPTRTPVAALAEMATWPDTLVVVVSHQSASAARSAADSVAQQSTAILRGRATAAQRRGDRSGKPPQRLRSGGGGRRSLLGVTIETEFKELRRVALAMARHRGTLWWLDPRCALTGRIDGAIAFAQEKTFAFLDARPALVGSASGGGDSWGGSGYTSTSPSCRPSFDAFGVIPGRWVHGYGMSLYSIC